MVGVFALLLLSASPAMAGSCTFPVTEVKWEGQTISGANVRDKTCMDSNIVGFLSGGKNITILGEADGWYVVKADNGAKGFIWNSFINVTNKSFTGEKASTEVFKEIEKTVVEKTVNKEVINKETAGDLTERLKGRILLQVENHGEAWYIHPTDGRRYYMKDGETAYEMMRSFGLGISNTDLDKAFAGNSAILQSIKGKIVLKVQDHGEAYYVHPETLKLHYLKDGSEAYRIMRVLSLGVTNKDLDRINKSDFVPLTDKESGESLEATGVLTLSGKRGDDGRVHLEWNVDGTDVSRGFKVVYGKSFNPTYPGDNATYLSDGSNRSYSFFPSISGEVHFRVCQYTGNGCGVYSNDVVLVIPQSTVEQGGIILKGSMIDGAAYLQWDVEGFVAHKGFKVVMSSNLNPVFGKNDAQYLESSEARAYKWKNLQPGTYHFRVCSFTGDGCVNYSNDIELGVGSTVEKAGSIELSTFVSGDDVFVTWKAMNFTSHQGFKVVMSSKPNPVYPGSDYHYKGNHDDDADEWHDLQPGTYYFRVCEYLGGTCGIYSNEKVVIINGEGATSATVPAGVSLEELNQYWLNQVNALRADRGLRQLVLDSRWNATATEWATYMGEHDLATHDRPDGKTMHQWIDTKGLPFTERYSAGGWSGNYFTENIAWGIAGSGTTASVKQVLDDTMDFYLSEASYNGAHYRTIYHEDWNSVGLGFHFTPTGNGYKVYVAMHYGSLVI